MMFGRFSTLLAIAVASATLSSLPPTVVGSAVAPVPAATATATAATAAAASASNNKSNPVVALAGYVKDAFVRTIDGCGTLWRNHQRCNRIRTKQRDHRDKLQKKWELEGRMTREEVKQRLKSINGGISYDEYAFLVKGKEDRAKLMQIAFLMWGAPRFLPYMLMFSPDMLPSPFSPLPDGNARESGLEKLSRERSHAVLQTLLNMEREAKKVPALAKLNIFGKKAQEQRMESMQTMGELTSKIMMTPGATGSSGAQVFLNNLSHYLYRDIEFTRGETRLIDAPKAIIKGVILAVEGPSPVNSILPHFMSRGKVVAHLKKIEDGDSFLVNEGIDLASLDSTHLAEACGERFIGGPDRTDEELRESLEEWLKLAVNQPSEKLQESGQLFYNSNLARLSLLCYHALDGTRDNRSASYLPRMLFQGQLLEDTGLIEGSGSTGETAKAK